MARNISEMESGEEIRFCRPKSYEFIKALKPGGTGKTILMQDTTINEKFVCKKYDPEQKEFEEEFYSRFVDEIKIMYSVYNSNIVRVFDYFLYPEIKTVILSILVYTFFSSMFDLMLPPAARHSIAAA